MDSFKSVKEVADYLKSRSVGAQCLLTGGGAVTKNVTNKFYRFGIRVKITGSFGSRIVELTQVFSEELRQQYLKPQKKYLATDKVGDTDSYPDNLAVGESGQVPAVNGRSLRQWVVSNYGPWTCSIRKDKATNTWIVTRLSATPDKSLFPLSTP